MVTQVLSQPDWINIPCFQQIPAFIVCQKIIHKEKGNQIFTKNGSKNMAVDICDNKKLLLDNRCILFSKYNNQINMSELKYDTNDIQSTEIMYHDQGTLFKYFTIIQNFYLKPLQFTISIPLNNTYLHYTPYQTTYYLKMTWKSKVSSNPITEYHGYMLSLNNPLKQTFPSNIFKCEDGSYINEISVCDDKIDCIEGADEKQCSCNNAMDVLPLGCKYFYNEKSNKCSCSSYYFTCLSSSTCIPYLNVCDGHRDCLYGEDEYCKNYIEKQIRNFVSSSPVNTFTCIESNITIPSILLNDFIPDCPGTIEDEMEYYNLMTNPFHTHISCKDKQKIPCIPGHSHCFYLNKLCIFEIEKNTKILKYCRNGAHLYNCTIFQCSEYFKCPLSYCIPFNVICNGEWDCPQGDDEASCNSYICPNLFKCKGQTKCLHFSKYCDNNKDCIFGDDESWCTNGSVLVCPKECKCFAQSLICTNMDNNLHHHIWSSVKYLKCISCNPHYYSKLFSSFQAIMFLNIKDHMFDSICLKKDENIPILYLLRHFDISSNRLTEIKNNCFFSLNRMITFHLQNNLISNLGDKSFKIFLYLNLLDLSHNRISKLRRTIFNGLTSIKTINLTFNPIMYIETDTFQGMSPKTIHSFNIQVCCMSQSWIKCKVKQDSFSKSNDLLFNKLMKYLYSLIGSLTIILNMISFFLDITKRKMRKQTQASSIIYLSVFNWLFGLYLVVIALADWHYKGNYIGLDMSWRNSLICKLSSFCVLVSLTVSPVILSILMLTKFCVIKWPMTSKLKDPSFVKRVIEISFTIVLAICINLISTIFIFPSKHNLSGICIPIFTPDNHSLPLLVTTLFIVNVKVFSLVTIVILSIFLLHILRKTEIQTKNRKYEKVSQKLFITILINICCCIPSSTFFILPVFGYHVHHNLLIWILVTVVSINPALDPFIFTILTPEMIKKYTTFYVNSVKKTLF